MYRIGLFSKIVKTTVKTLRYYEEVGLLSPDYIDEENRYRYYSTSQLPEIHKIIGLRQMGFSIDEVSGILRNENVEFILNLRKEEIQSQLKEVQDQLSRINHYILERNEDEEMKYQAMIKEVPECIVYSKELVAPSYESYFQLIPAIGEEVKALNPDLKCAVPEYCFIEYKDGEYREKDITIEYFEAVTEFGVESDSIKFKKLPSAKVVSVMHKGDYSKLKNVYAYTFKWLEENNYTIAGNPRESYIDGIWNQENENAWLTELQVPIKFL